VVVIMRMFVFAIMCMLVHPLNLSTRHPRQAP
jgi:hypothetical protein